MEVDPHLGTHFGTFGLPFTKFGTPFTKFGTFFIKFGTSNPISTRTYSLSPMVHYFIWAPIRKLLEVDPHFDTHFETPDTFFTKFGTSF